MRTLLEKIQPDPCTPDTARGRTDTPANPQERLLRSYLHKTSNSLCGIKGYASLIAGLGQDAEANEHWARKIIGEVEKMELIFASVDELTTRSRPGDPGIDPAVVLKNSLQSAITRHAHLQVRLAKVPHGRLMLPAADLTQVLRDILDNAAEGATGHQSRVGVWISGRLNERGRINMLVRDDAGGIPLHLGSQVRDPFVTAKAGHVGIGLTRVETILDMHGLAWTLESIHGQGTTVTMEVAAPVSGVSALAGKACDGA